MGENPRHLFMSLETLTSIPKQFFRVDGGYRYFHGIRVIVWYEHELFALPNDLQEFYANGGIDMPEGKCEVSGCRRASALGFYGKQVCQKHYDMDGKDGFDLKKELGVKEVCSIPRCTAQAVKKYIVNDVPTHLCMEHAQAMQTAMHERSATQ